LCTYFIPIYDRIFSWRNRLTFSASIIKHSRSAFRFVESLIHLSVTKILIVCHTIWETVCVDFGFGCHLFKNQPPDQLYTAITASSPAKPYIWGYYVPFAGLIRFVLFSKPITFKLLIIRI
jgi:hypothetical protein